MTRTAGARPEDNSEFARDWDAMRAEGDVQFAPVEIPVAPPSEPGWLSHLFEWLASALDPVARFVGPNWPVIKWVLLALVVALVAFAIWRIVEPLVLAPRSRPIEEAGFVPDQARALELLDEADRLAAEGRYDEATRLLLRRSVGQIADARPDLIDPSSTAREISALPALPEVARKAFATIAERVERSLFALRSLSADDWHAARAAYAEFALGYGGLKAGQGR
ncbi:hypothetical protein M3P36_10155 [Altererythrobacter sp. KTW20L]|nr:hypothetical protein [Altererythrobacter sp. KTW20L]